MSDPLDTLFRQLEALREHDSQMPMQTARLFLLVARQPSIELRTAGDELQMSVAQTIRHIERLTGTARQSRLQRPLVALKGCTGPIHKTLTLTPDGAALAAQLQLAPLAASA